MNYFNKSAYVYMSMFVSVCEYVCMRGLCVCVVHVFAVPEREELSFSH